MTELKKCPHCGGEAEIYIQNKKWTIECKNCFCKISHYTMDSDEMTNAWNKRDGLSMDEIRAVLRQFANSAFEKDCQFSDEIPCPEIKLSNLQTISGDCRECLMQEFQKKARG